ncbi:MAG: DNA translocase FtsK 4TM domain-containing protein [Myxococcota bacterium]
MGAPQTTSPGELVAEEGRRHEVLAIVSLAITVLLALALWSYDARGGENWIGPVGSGVASLAATAFGFAAWLLPIEFGLATIRLFARSRSLLGLATIASTLVIVLVGCAMVHLALDGEEVFGGHLPGGVLGEVLGEVLRSLLGTAGAYVVGSAVLLITLVLRTPVSLITMVHRSARTTGAGLRSLGDGTKKLFRAWREAKLLEREERKRHRREAAPKIVKDQHSVHDFVIDDEELEGPATVVDLPAPRHAEDKGPAAEGLTDQELEDAFLGEDDPEDHAPTKGKKRKRPSSKNKAKAKAAKTAQAAKARAGAASPPESDSPSETAPKIVPPVSLAKQDPPKDELEVGPIVPPKRKNDEPFVLPPTTLLDQAPNGTMRIDAVTLRENAVRLVEKLEAYGVKGRVDEIHPGPVVTMYEFEPQSGTKVSKIAGLADDLAMALAAQKVRIVAPIPGKARVGFELPNDTRQTVYLRAILEDERWNRSKANLPIALGQDIAGQPVYGDLAKMPHLLVAGATGSGKSVGLNVMLASLLLKKTPEEVRLLMIDPKVVELAVFDGSPHMLLPVVTDMKKAALSLRWAVDEMERRYQLFADAGARNIKTYNERVQKVLDGTMAPEKLTPSRKGKVRAQDHEGKEVLLNPVDGETPNAVDAKPEKLPYVVVVVDEFADLMMVAAKDVEAAIARLAQKARAAGIHVILATQRPSVDVITGMIKANFPARMAFKVSQREDSKTILGRVGAEHLLGMGDMLMIPPGSSDLKRVHSAYISEDEVKEVCDFLRAQGKPVYDNEILKPRDDEEPGGGAKSDDPIYDKAVAVVAQAGYCSISHIQRQLSVGYNKAAKLVERMEKEGVVGPPTSKAGGRREVLIQSL